MAIHLGLFEGKNLTRIEVHVNNLWKFGRPVISINDPITGFTYTPEKNTPPKTCDMLPPQLEPQLFERLSKKHIFEETVPSVKFVQVLREMLGYTPAGLALVEALQWTDEAAKTHRGVTSAVPQVCHHFPNLEFFVWFILNRKRRNNPLVEAVVFELRRLVETEKTFQFLFQLILRYIVEGVKVILQQYQPKEPWDKLSDAASRCFPVGEVVYYPLKDLEKIVLETLQNVLPICNELTISLKCKVGCDGRAQCECWKSTFDFPTDAWYLVLQNIAKLRLK